MVVAAEPERTSAGSDQPDPLDLLELDLLDLAAGSPDTFAAVHGQGEFVLRPHIEEMAEAIVNALEGRGPRRIAISMPPRHGKSHFISKWLPVWLLDRHPAWRVAVVSYAKEIAEELAGETKDIVQRLIWEGKTDLRIRRTRGVSFSTTAGGRLHVTSKGGQLTGRGYNVIVLDDLIKDDREAENELSREAAWQWFVKTLRTRLEPGGILIYVGTRWHDDDLIGRILAQQEQLQRDAPELAKLNEWKVIRFPALAEEDETIGRWQRSKGDPLWPERYSKQELELTRLIMGPEAFATVYQQNPLAASGLIWQRPYWLGQNRFDLAAPRDCVARIISLDTAIREKQTADWSVAIVLELTPRPYRLRVVDVRRVRLELPKLIRWANGLAEHWNQDGKLRAMVVEDMVSGTGLIQTMRATGAQWLRRKVVAAAPSGDKSFRAKQAAVWAANDSIDFPEAAPWLFDFEEELYAFPRGRHDDQSDALAQGVIFVRKYLEIGLRERLRASPGGVLFYGQNDPFADLDDAA